PSASATSKRQPMSKPKSKTPVPKISAAKPLAVKPITEGDLAPAFDLPTAGGGRVGLAGLKGKRVVLYFYPKDDTPACTTEALNFTEKARSFANANAVVVGVSRDSPAKHAKFAAKYGLKVQLASDEDGQVCNLYGVWVEKALYGRKYMGVE